MTKWFLIGAGIALFIYLSATKGIKLVLRGFRNHNPGNLRISDVPWRGKVPLDKNTDGSFEQFQDIDGKEADFWGLRANMINILAKYESGATTLNKLGEVWAPASDNNGDTSYGINLGSHMDFDPDATLDIPSNLAAVMNAIILNEESINPYPDTLMVEASTSALQSKGYI